MFGYFYFSTAANQPKRNDLNWRIWFVMNVVFGLVTSFKSSEMSVGRNTSSIIVNIAMRIVIAQTQFMPTIFRVSNFAVRQSHEKLLRNVQEIDDELKKMKIDINYSKHFVVAVSVTLSYYAFLCLTFYVDDNLSLKYLDVSEISIVAALLSAFNIFAYLSFQISHMFVVFAIYKRLQLLNRSLKMANVNVPVLKQFGRLHCKLADSLELLNQCFAVNLLSYFLQFTIYCIFHFYGFYHYLTSSPDMAFRDFILNTISFFYLLFFFWFGAWMIVVSSWIKSEGNKTALLAHSKMIINDPKTLRACNDLCLQLCHIKPNISCGLFIVDWTFLFTFISALFSYLIILIQFANS